MALKITSTFGLLKIPGAKHGEKKVITEL